MTTQSNSPSNLSSDPISTMSKNNTYILRTSLKGHTGLVLCMSATEDGKLLASGGIDGVRIWDLSRNATAVSKSWNPLKITCPTGAGDRGATTSLAWIRRKDEPDDGLIYGTANGFIICWRDVSNGRESAYEETFTARTANPSEVTAIAFESGSNHLAVSNRNSVVSLFRVGPKFDLHPIFSVVLKDHIPKALAFSLSGDSYKDIYTFGLYDGLIHTLNGKNGKVEETHQTGCQIGNVSAKFRRGVFCIDDPSQGAAVYRYSSWDRARTYRIPVEKSMRPRQIAFVDDCQTIVSGSDHGVVYIYDRRSGKILDELKSGKGRIQSLTASGDNSDKPIIFSAMSLGEDDLCPIYVWQRDFEATEKQPSRRAQNERQASSWGTLLFVIFQFSFLIIAIVFLLQNTSVSTFPSF